MLLGSYAFMKPEERLGLKSFTKTLLLHECFLTIVIKKKTLFVTMSKFLICRSLFVSQVTDWEGDDINLEEDQSERRIIFPAGGILVSNGSLHDQLLEMISSASPALWFIWLLPTVYTISSTTLQNVIITSCGTEVLSSLESFSYPNRFLCFLFISFIGDSCVFYTLSYLLFIYYCLVVRYLRRSPHCSCSHNKQVQY